MAPLFLHKAAVIVAALLLAVDAATAQHTTALEPASSASARNLLAQEVVVAPATSMAQHAFDFRVAAGAAVQDTGAAGAWATSALEHGGVVITPSTSVTGAMTIKLSASYSATDNVTRTVFNLGGLTFRINPSAINVGVNVSDFADFSNTAGASVRCSQVTNDARTACAAACCWACTAALRALRRSASAHKCTRTREP
jgi:hypothetical protein